MKSSVKSMLLAAKVGLAVLSFTLFSGFGDRFEGGFGGGFRGGFGGGFGRASGGSAPKAPEDAVAGIYMNLDKGVGNCLEVANLIADESPEIRNELRNGIVEFKKILKDKLGSEDALRWAFLTIHFDASRMANGMDPGLGCAVCVKDAGKALAFLTETEGLHKTDATIAGHDVYSLDDESKIIRYENILIFTDGDTDNDGNVLESLIRAYDGTGRLNKNFDSISRLDGNYFARILVPAIGDTIKRLGFEKKIEEIAELSGDNKLKETICEFGDITLDLALNKNNINVKLDVTAANVEDAKFIEGLFNTYIGLMRFVNDGIVIAMAERPQSKDVQILKAIIDLYRDSCSVSRNGRTTVLTTSLKTQKLLKFILETGMMHQKPLAPLSRETACREVISTIETSLNAYYADHGRLPDSLEALVTSTDDEEPYLIGGRDKLMDPWGTKIDYKPGRRGNFELRSAGPDCVLGNNDDITNNRE